MHYFHHHFGRLIFCLLQLFLLLSQHVFQAFPYKITKNTFTASQKDAYKGPHHTTSSPAGYTPHTSTTSQCRDVCSQHKKNMKSLQTGPWHGCVMPGPSYIDEKYDQMA